jgi:prepilin-type N-terminal cleavage/methylation domain-containing protein
MKEINKSKGMTLVELLVALAIFAVVMVAVGALGANIFRYKSDVSGSFQTNQSSHVIFKTILKELREIAPGANGAYPIAQAGSTTLAFFSDYDNDGVTEKITYALVGTNLYRAVIQPTGSPASYLTANQSTSTILTNVTNGNAIPSFEYFDSSYTGTSSPLVHPVNPSLVRLIKINQRLEIDPNRSPLPIIYSVQVNLRNLKSNL